MATSELPPNHRKIFGIFVFCLLCLLVATHLKEGMVIKTDNGRDIDDGSDGGGGSGSGEGIRDETRTKSRSKKIPIQIVRGGNESFIAEEPEHLFASTPFSSSLRCFGNLEWQGLTHCEFRNVCVRNGSIWYAQDPVHPTVVNWESPGDMARVPEISPHDTQHVLYEGVEWQYQHLVYTSRVDARNQWSPNVIPGPIREEVEWRPETLIVEHRHAAGNAGHFLWETLAVAVAAVVSTGSLAEDSFRLAFLDDCNKESDYPTSFGYPVSDCHRYSTEITAYVTDLAPLVVPETAGTDKFTCYPTALVGFPFADGFNPTAPVAPLWPHAELRNLAYKRRGFPIRRPFDEPIVITINAKTAGRHSGYLYNRDEIRAHLEKTFPTYKGLPVEIRVLDLPSTPIHDQLEVWSTTDVYLSTGGSGAFMAPLLPTGSIMVIIPGCFKVSPGEVFVHHQWIFRNSSTVDPDGSWRLCYMWNFELFQRVPHMRIVPLAMSLDDFVGDLNGMSLALPPVERAIHDALNWVFESRRVNFHSSHAQSPTSVT